MVKGTKLNSYSVMMLHVYGVYGGGRKEWKTMSLMYMIQLTIALRDVLAYTLSTVRSRLNLFGSCSKCQYFVWLIEERSICLNSRWKGSRVDILLEHLRSLTYTLTQRWVTLIHKEMDKLFLRKEERSSASNLVVL